MWPESVLRASDAPAADPLRLREWRKPFYLDRDRKARRAVVLAGPVRVVSLTARRKRGVSVCAIWD